MKEYYQNIEYKYEPLQIQLIHADGSMCNYTPDLYASDHYIEIKGWWDEKSKLKRMLMESQHPEIKIEYIGEEEYDELKRFYKERISLWE